MPNSVQRDITVIGGSAGSLAPLRELLCVLPADHPAALFVVVHSDSSHAATLRELLTRHTERPMNAIATEAAHGLDVDDYAGRREDRGKLQI